MDVLRGVALFGVFLMNLVAFASPSIMATEEQLMLLPSAPLDFTLFDVLGWLVADKANTIFAFLFGLGFALQLQRLEGRGVDFEALYRRRLTVLLVIGVIHFSSSGRGTSCTCTRSRDSCCCRFGGSAIARC